MQSLKCLIGLLVIGVFNIVAHGQRADILYRVNDVAYASPSINHTFTDSEVIPRLQVIQSAIPPQYTNVVKGYIRTYTIKNRPKTERILGRAVMYFPIFEELLRKNGLPESLKYLSVTESALNPVAVSSAKAVGLWQFIKTTGQEYGLRIDQSIDERCDPHLSTAAAAAYLRRQYERFGDWALAIAAYNSGPGNVSKAIRRGRSKNFWKIKKYLPKETRSYVPGYIAAAYILQHYEEHGLIPQYPAIDLQLTEAVKIYDFINFQTISAMTGVPMTTIKELNPSFLQNYIPTSQRGYYLILPKRVMAYFKEQLERPDSEPVYTTTATATTQSVYVHNPSPAMTNDNYTLSYHTVQQNEHLHVVAQLYNCHPYHIKIWNDLQSNYLQPGQSLKIYIPKKTPITSNKIINTPKEKIIIPALRSIPISPVTSLISSDIITSNRPKENDSEKSYEYHIIQRYESLREIAQKYKTSVKKILEYNQVKKGRFFMPGDKIKVKVINH